MDFAQSGIVWKRDSVADGFEQLKRGVFDGGGFGVEDEIRAVGWLEGAVFSGEVLDFAASGFGVEAFDVALFTSFVAGLDVDFEEVLAEESAGEIAEFATGCDGGDEGDDALGNEDF